MVQGQVFVKANRLLGVDRPQNQSLMTLGKDVVRGRLADGYRFFELLGDRPTSISAYASKCDRRAGSPSLEIYVFSILGN
jgi:hypothetical protein